MPISSVGGFTQLPVIGRAQGRQDADNSNNRNVSNGVPNQTISDRHENSTAVSRVPTDVAATQVVPNNRETVAIPSQDNRRLSPLIVSSNQGAQLQTDTQLVTNQVATVETNNIVITEQQQQLQRRFQQSSLPIDNTSRLIDERV